jgi:hypothetical protein
MQRTGDEEPSCPVLPESMVAKIDEHMSGVDNDRSWGFLVPRLQLLIEMQRL